MSCNACKDIVLESRCGICGDLPTDLQYAMLQEARDSLDAIASFPNPDIIILELYRATLKLVGLNLHLLREIKNLKQQINNMNKELQ